MNIRRILSLALFVGGIVCIGYAMHYKEQIANAKTFTENTENFFNHNPSAWNGLIEFFGGEAQTKLSEYDAQVLTLLVVGIALAVFGLIGFVLPRKKGRGL